MKILLVNKFYYPRGGDCIYTINLESLLKSQGHEVAIFAMQHPENLPSKYSSYFPSEIDYSSFNKKNLLKAIVRPFGSKEVRNLYCKLLDDFNPDVVHLQNIHSQISPIVAEEAHERGIKVVWTLHDYKLLCSISTCIRNNQSCELCSDNKINVVKYKCLKNSLFASTLAYLEALKWDQHHLQKYVSTFVCPSSFMSHVIARGGIDKQKLKTLCNFIDHAKSKSENYSKDDYCCYLGRISSEKGIKTLLEVAKTLPYKLKIIGDGPLLNEMKKNYSSFHNIQFLGHQDWIFIKAILGQAKFMILPSEWNENNPFSIIESQCLGTPVLGANIGGIPELIEEGVNGELFTSGNAGNLKNKIIQMFEQNKSQEEYDNIASMAQKKYSSDYYYQELLKIYQS